MMVFNVDGYPQYQTSETFLKDFHRKLDNIIEEEKRRIISKLKQN